MIAIYLLAEDNAGSPANAQDAMQWANQHGLHFPVLADPGWGVAGLFEHDNYIPSSSLLAPGLQAVIVDGNVTTNAIQNVLP